MTASTRPEFIATIVMAFVAGFVDTLGFVALFGLFTAHVTGNFVLIGASLGGGTTAGLLAKLLALPMFIVAAALATLVIRSRERRGRPAARVAIGLQIILLAAFAALGIAASPISDPDALLPLLTALVGVAAMAVQNAHSRLVFARAAPSTVMTGNVTQLVIDMVDALRGNADARAGLRRFGPPVLAFAFGAAGGAAGFLWVGFAALALPVILLAAVLLTFTGGRPTTPG